MKKYLVFFLVTFILISCEKTPEADKEPDMPVAKFTSENKTKGVVQFTSTSEFTEEHAWDFGDGKTSTDKNPLHTYEKNGEYKVSLTVKNPNGSNTTSQTINVTDLNYALAEFTFKVEVGKVTFTNTSKYGETYAWEFGDGKTSTVKDPVHTYEKNGEYKVNLTVTNNLGKNTTSQTVKVTDLNYAVADFTFSISAGKATFTNASKFGETYAWEFGDGEKSTEQNPVHTYKENKTYAVKLTATNKLGSHSVTKSVAITGIVPEVSTNNNLLFIANNFAGTSQYIRAVDASNGTIKWSNSSYSGYIRGGITLVDNVLYFGDDQNFYAANASNGSIKWKFSLPQGMDNTPLVQNGVVYFGAKNNKIYALNASDGSKKWEFNTDAAINASPIIHNQVLYVGSMGSTEKGGTFYAVNVSNGSLKWQRGSYFGAMSTKAVAIGNNVYFGGTGGFHTLNNQTGDLVSHFYFKLIGSSPIISGNILYSIVDGEKLSAINLSSGNAIWTYDLKTPSANNYSSPILQGDVLYTSTQTSVVAINRTNGSVIWEHKGRDFNGQNLTYANGVIYAANKKGSSNDSPTELLALDAKTGKVLFTKDINGQLGDITVLGKTGASYYPNVSGQ